MGLQARRVDCKTIAICRMIAFEGSSQPLVLSNRSALDASPLGVTRVAIKVVYKDCKQCQVALNCEMFLLGQLQALCGHKTHGAHRVAVSQHICAA